jgi:ribosomal protein S18 acetylase RimI-like enzyme
MDPPPTVRFQHHTRDIDWTTLELLYKAAALGGREGDKLRRAFENSQVVCFVFAGPRLIGAARALTDFEYHATIYDVVIHPDHQRRGIGGELMRELLKRLPVWRVLLVADGDAARFYGRLGFQPYGDVMALLDRSRLHD